MSKTKSIVFQLKFVDLLNKPFPNLYHEIRESGKLISINRSDDQGLGTRISRPPGTILDIQVRHPLTKKMMTVSSRIAVPPKKGNIKLKASFSIQTIKLRALNPDAGSYKRSTHKVVTGTDEHEVKKGQDLYTIAKMHNTTWQILAQLNKATIKDPDKIVHGQIIKVPPKGSSLTGTTNDKPDSLKNQTNYKVKKGETLSGISERSGVSVEQLKRMNGITDPTTLQGGQTIKLRSDGSAQTHTTPKPIPTARPTPKPSSKPSSSDEDEGVFGGVLESIGEGLGALGNRAKEGLESVNDAMSGGKNDKPAGGAPTAGTDAKTKADIPIKIPVEQEYSSKDGTPKAVSGSVCTNDPACLFKGKATNEVEKRLVLEVNIRLAGFGGALPTEDFTDLTEQCIKQFQRDYMQAPETGKICGSLIKAIDEFNYEYPIASYHEQMKCPCGQCSGFGNGRMGVSSGNNIANEYPGIHRSLTWVMKACIFYLTDDNVNYSFKKVNSGYRCINNNVQKGRTSVNHMGMALDFHFNYKTSGNRARNQVDIERIREQVFVGMMGAQFAWTDPNKISLELSRHGATSWVHVDVREYEDKYKDTRFFAKTVGDMIGGDLSTYADNKIRACGGDFINNQVVTEDCTTKFNKISSIILQHEGGYVDDPNDKGGKTNKGIAWRTWLRYAKSDLGLEPTVDNLRDITDEQAEIIYRKRYWEPKGFCKVENDRVGLMVYDWTITSGGAHRQVQNLLNDEFGQTVTVDGDIGPNTISAINSVEDQNLFLERVATIRRAYYRQLVVNDSRNERFIKGWLNRVEDCLNVSIP